MTADCTRRRVLGMQVHTEQSLANIVKFDTSACQVSTMQRGTSHLKQRQQQLLPSLPAHHDIE